MGVNICGNGLYWLRWYLLKVIRGKKKEISGEKYVCGIYDFIRDDIVDI